MHTSHQAAKGSLIGNVLQAGIGVGGRINVSCSQAYAGQYLDDKSYQGCAAKDKKPPHLAGLWYPVPGDRTDKAGDTGPALKPTPTVFEYTHNYVFFNLFL